METTLRSKNKTRKGNKGGFKGIYKLILKRKYNLNMAKC